MKKNNFTSENEQKKCTKLQEYLLKNHIIKKYFAQKIGVSEQVLSRWIMGKAIPGIKVALAIEKETGGQVSCEDWIT
jgi:DNA-binding XRE family transcriptional regulator